jgi:hypothetical protein
MLTPKNRILATLIITLLVSPAAFGQKPATGTMTSRGDDENVTEKNFRTRLFEVKHRDPNQLFKVVRTLGSGFKGSSVSVNNELKTITVRDFPENLAVIEEALKRLDTPEAPSPSIEFRIHVLVASNAAPAANDYPAELSDTVKQLQSTLKYKSYVVMASSTHRTREGAGEVSNKGVAEAKLFDVTTPQNNPIFYGYGLRSVSLDGAAVKVENFTFEIRFPINVGTEMRWEPLGFNTPVRINEGERVVVGTTTLQDRALMVVLSAKIIR